jgi:hypothetical protein
MQGYYVRVALQKNEASHFSPRTAKQNGPTAPLILQEAEFPCTFGTSGSLSIAAFGLRSQGAGNESFVVTQKAACPADYVASIPRLRVG